jgi:CubicO group peptidase (beta-lactamase class C family)
MNADVLSGLAPQFEGWREANLHAALMVRHGRIVYERYFTGEDRAWGTALGQVEYHAGLRHDLRSITKSIVSLLFGIASDRGLVQDPDEPVFSFVPEYAALKTPEKARITLRHVLTMSAGLAWNEYIPYSDPANSERRMMDAPDRYRYVLEQPSVRPAGAAYNYSGGLTALLAEILQKRSGSAIDALANEALFGPLGIRDLEWGQYADGAVNISGLRMRPRDLAKIGQLVLTGGMWNDRRVVSKTWIEDSTSPHVHGEGLFFYGYQWWLGRSLVNRREVQWISAVGWGGQRMYIVPSLDLVVVVTAGLYDNPILMPVIGEIILRRYALPAALAA